MIQRRNSVQEQPQIRGLKMGENLQEPVAVTAWQYPFLNKGIQECSDVAKLGIFYSRQIAGTNA